MDDFQEQQRVARAVRDYIRTARAGGHRPFNEPGWLPTDADLGHSALFQRLLRGERIYKVPPPNAYSYPWYQLIDTGQYAFNDNHHTPVYIKDDVVSICQDSRWSRLPNGELTFYGPDRWELRDVSTEDKIETGGVMIGNDGPEPIYANKILIRIDSEDIW